MMQNLKNEDIDLLIEATPAPEAMQESKRIGEEDLIVGRHYLRFEGGIVRRIDAIKGDLIHFRDTDGTGCFKKDYFLKLHTAFAPPGTTLPFQGSCDGEITLRHEAEALAAFAFDCAFIESWGRMTDNAMWRSMVDASERLSQMLELKQTDSDQYEAKIRECHEKYCRTWRRE